MQIQLRPTVGIFLGRRSRPRKEGGHQGDRVVYGQLGAQRLRSRRAEDTSCLLYHKQKTPRRTLRRTWSRVSRHFLVGSVLE